MGAALRAFFGYFFLVFMVRIVGRRPGKQLTPFEFVLVFFMGGLALTAMVGDEVSFTNALLQIIAIAAAHYTVVWLRSRSSQVARVLDGTPLFLLKEGQWCADTMRRMSIHDDDVMATARDNGIKSLDQIETAVLERNGEISVVQAKDESKSRQE